MKVLNDHKVALVLHRQLDEGERIYDKPEGGSDEEEDDPYR